MVRKNTKHKLNNSRKHKGFCILPVCSRCGNRLHNENGFKKTIGSFSSYCKTCNTDIGFMRKYKNASFVKINKRISEYKHLIDLLTEVKAGKND